MREQRFKRTQFSRFMYQRSCSRKIGLFVALQQVVSRENGMLNKEKVRSVHGVYCVKCAVLLGTIFDKCFSKSEQSAHVQDSTVSTK